MIVHERSLQAGRQCAKKFVLALTIYGLDSGSDDYAVVLAVVIYQILFGSAVHSDTTDISELVRIVNSVSPSRPRNNGVVEMNLNYGHAGH